MSEMCRCFHVPALFYVYRQQLFAKKIIFVSTVLILECGELSTRNKIGNLEE